LASGLLAPLTLRAAQLQESGYQVRVLAAPAVKNELGAVSVEVLTIEEAGLGKILSELRPDDLLVLGSIGFELGRAVTGLNDQDPWVRLITQGLLKKVQVVLVSDELSAAPGTPLESKTSALLRDLSALGIQPVALDDLATLAGSYGRSGETGGLLTEADVERLVNAGERRLVLPRRTVVTPLALSRAFELGLEIVKEDS
jgi:hypothetical protein